MKIFKNKINLINEISSIKDIAFVPTMGSIHKGHLSLIKIAKNESKNILVSIYINPKQFNSSLDYKKYPRNLYKDINILKKNKIKYLYIPNFNDVYGFKTNSPIYVDKFSKELCGRFRPDHFKGVINVINRFLEIIKPKKIYLGMKDLQQLSLIKSHIIKNKINTNVVTCPTIRERNGVALSSRNIKLTKKQLNIASKIFKLLKHEKKQIRISILNKKKNKILNEIKQLGASKIDYLECVNFKTLNFKKVIKTKFNIFIAYYIGKVRLIDNL